MEVASGQLCCVSGDRSSQSTIDCDDAALGRNVRNRFLLPCEGSWRLFDLIDYPDVRRRDSTQMFFSVFMESCWICKLLGSGYHYTSRL